MPAKRNRDGSAVTDSAAADPSNASIKPISAIAAARLRAQQLEAAAIAAASSLNVPSSPVEDPPSSEIEEEVAEEIAIEPQRNLRLCTWRYGKDYVSSESDDELTVSLNKGTTIALIGCFDFTILKGAININGANYGARSKRSKGVEARRAFVPSTHPISTIRGLDSENEVRFVNCEAPTPFANLSPLFKNIWNAEAGKIRKRSFSLITETDADPLHRPMAPELVPEDWLQQVEECATSSSSTLVTGGPYTGKSIFAKRLLNRHLTGLGKAAQPVASVLYLDLDPTKPAYTPHGQIALVQVQAVDLGPSFTHPSTIPKSTGDNEVLRAHPMPMNALLHQQDHYLACAGDLIRLSLVLRQREPSTPLIVNIPGVLCATEFDVLLQILRLIKPQRVVHLSDLQSIDEETAAKLDALDVAARKTGGTVNQISAQGNLNVPSRTDSELRGMNMLSYFHCTGLVKSGPRHFTFSSKPLSHELPWEFCYDETNQSEQDFIGFLMLSEWLDSSQILTALNGSVIHIVETNEAAVQEQYGMLPRTAKFRIPYFPKSVTGAVEPLNPTTSHLVCTALIRGWDPERKVVQLVVPKTHEGLLQDLKPEKTVFVFGCCETPEWAYTEDAYYQLSQQTQSGDVDEKTAAHGIPLPSWVARGPVVDNMGYMNVPRRVRKFQQG